MDAIPTIHPFAARMAPELAISALQTLPAGSTVLDPMAGSGVVLRHASELGHRALGFDLDPLSVLMAGVWTTPVDVRQVAALAEDLVRKARGSASPPVLDWIDKDEETSAYVAYWFADAQADDLRRLAYLIGDLPRSEGKGESTGVANVLRLALSRIIITKDRGASLARDVSHSRPHKVCESSCFEVIPAFERSVSRLCRLLSSRPPRGGVCVTTGDARSLRSLGNGSIDAVLTSPPYLNAIDYMRGHRLALVWLGYRLGALRQVRSTSIGAERGPDNRDSSDRFRPIRDAMIPSGRLSSRHAAMVTRYAEDLYGLMSEISRVMKGGGRAVLVVGNSCLKETFIRNSEGLRQASAMVGLRLQSQSERELPLRNRYLPVPPDERAPLGKRMRTEVVMTFVNG